MGVHYANESICLISPTLHNLFNIAIVFYIIQIDVASQRMSKAWGRMLPNYQKSFSHHFSCCYSSHWLYLPNSFYFFQFKSICVCVCVWGSMYTCMVLGTYQECTTQACVMLIPGLMVRGFIHTGQEESYTFTITPCTFIGWSRGSLTLHSKYDIAAKVTT